MFYVGKWRQNWQKVEGVTSKPLEVVVAKTGRRTTAEQASAGIDLNGQNALVTGANTGLGKETARVLALRGAHVVMACRNQEKAEAARRELIDGSNGAISEEQLQLLELDLNNLAATRAAAENFLALDMPLHILVNNAGIMIPMERRTDDGFEAHFGINHLAHFLFTNLIVDSLKKAEGARVVVLSSAAQSFASMKADLKDLNWEERKHSGMRSYGDSKLMNVMFAREFNRRHRDDGIVANSLHPGIIGTELARDQEFIFILTGIFAFPFMKSVPQGAATSVFVATSPEYQDNGGHYFVNCQRRPRPDNKLALDEAVCRRLWAISEELTGFAS
jgi:retinol dehydrogenase 12